MRLRVHAEEEVTPLLHAIIPDTRRKTDQGIGKKRGREKKHRIYTLITHYRYKYLLYTSALLSKSNEKVYIQYCQLTGLYF